MNKLTSHYLIRGDARKFSYIEDESVHLVITSPPYWTLKKYNEHPEQMGHIGDYEHFLLELLKVWKESYRVLVPGGRLICVVGDVCLSRKEFGRHVVVPLHADIAVGCRKIGFDNLNPILWHKISNAHYEVSNGSSFLGKPYEPNAIIKNDIEFILMQRKPGGYRQPTMEQRKHSMIAKEEFNTWFKQIWTIKGASTREHPAPYPLELAYRLVRMFSFQDDIVLDPFCGSGTSILAAMKAGRNSVGIEIDPKYCNMIMQRLDEEKAAQPKNFSIKMHDASNLKALKIMGDNIILNGHSSLDVIKTRLNRKLGLKIGRKKEISKLVTSKP